MNSLNILGRLTRDPELNYSGQTARCNFSIGFSKKFKNAAGQETEQAHFFDCVAWGKRGETIAKYFKKGQRILIVNAELRQERWQDKTTQANRSKVTINVNDFDFIELKRDQVGGNEQGSSQQTPPAAAAPPDFDAPDFIPTPNDDEVPF